MKYIGITSPMFSIKGKNQKETFLSNNLDYDLDKYNNIKTETYKFKNYPKFSFGKQEKFCNKEIKKQPKI